uniref:Coenzyme Q5, methyltransferase n=1 Tax=Hucho hucho TaxID=62062 RepID=A0A4W5QJV0_9TELE
SACRCFSDGARDKSTYFGFETVPEGEKAKRERAQKYDMMNDAMSLGVHQLWKDLLLHVMNLQPRTRLLDVAGGTGDISFRFLDYVRSQHEHVARRAKETEAEPRESRPVVCDINKEMLKVGKQKVECMGISSGRWRFNLKGRLLYDAYSFQMIPVLAEVNSGTWKSYWYLVERFRKKTETFKGMIEEASLFSVRYHNLTGGVVTLNSGFKM